MLTTYARAKAKHSLKLLFGLTIKSRQEQHMLHSNVYKHFLKRYIKTGTNKQTYTGN